MKERSSRACQACRLRKVKCDGNGDNSCTKCTKLSLKCSYPDPNSEARLRRSTVRGSVIQAYVDPQRQQSGSTGEQPVSRIPISITGTLEHHVSGVEVDFFLSLASDYAAYLLPTFPVISESEYVAAVGRVNQNQDDYALVHIIAAATWTAVGQQATSTALYLDQVRSLYTKAINVRGHVFATSDISTYSIAISVFMAKCCADAEDNITLGKYYLRDAISRLQLLRVNDPHVQAQLTVDERCRRERLYWIMFVQERYDALETFRPPVLNPLPDLPKHDTTMSSVVHAGFIHLIQLFRMIDANFIRYRLNGLDTSIPLDWIREKQAELGSDDHSREGDFGSLSLLQQVDLSVTRNWLRALVWQMSLHVLSMLPEGQVEEDYMSILFPVHLSHNLRSLLSDMPIEAVEVHSTGILHKIFEIAAILADVLEHIVVQVHDSDQQSEYVDNFVFLSRFLLSMPRFNERRELEQKFDRVHSIFPWYFERVNELGTMW